MKEIRSIILVVGISLTLCIATSAQTYQFSQYYNTYQLLNPSFSGITGQRYRVGFINRFQWLGISSESGVPFRTTGIFGHYVFKHPLATGVLNPNAAHQRFFSSIAGGLLQNNQAKGLLKVSTAMVSYAGMLQVGSDAHLSVGFEANYQNARVSDYILINDFLNGNIQANPGLQVSYFNMSMGATFIKKNTWLGASLKDVLPIPRDPTFITQNLGFYDNLNIHGGQAFPVGQFSTLKFSASWKRFQRFQQFESALGLYYNFQNGFSAGTSLGARGWVKSRPEALNNMDALIWAVSINNWRPENWKEGKTITKNKGNISLIFSVDFYSFNFGSNFTPEFTLIFNAPHSRYVRRDCYDYSGGPMADQIALNLYGGRSPYKPKDDKDNGPFFTKEKMENTKWPEPTKDKKKRIKQRYKRIR